MLFVEAKQSSYGRGRLNAHPSSVVIAGPLSWAARLNVSFGDPWSVSEDYDLMVLHTAIIRNVLYVGLNGYWVEHTVASRDEAGMELFRCQGRSPDLTVGLLSKQTDLPLLNSKAFGDHVEKYQSSHSYTVLASFINQTANMHTEYDQQVILSPKAPRTVC